MITRQLLLFLLFGFATVAVDSAIYITLLNIENFPFGVAKAISFILGTIFAYVVNKKWTFGNRGIAPRSYIRFFMLYAVTLLVNVSINHLILQVVDGALVFQSAFLFATLASATLNFLGMRFFVFR